MCSFVDDPMVALTRTHAGRRAALACLFTFAAAPAPLAADWPQCLPSTVPPAPAAALESTTIEADSVIVRGDGVSVAEGSAVMRSPGRTITAHRMEYDTETGRAAASGEAAVRNRELFLEGDRLHTDPTTGGTVVHGARFSHPESHGRGDAERIEAVPGVTVLTGGSFTTCDPGSNAWSLRARTLELNHTSRTGVARHARLEIRGVPVLYTPWVSFPLGSDRKTGFLTPSIGASRKTGTTAVLPYYLNLAPNYDATLRLRHMSRRGQALEGRFRYLTERGDGAIEAEGLPEDRVTGDARTLVSLRHRHRFTPGLEARAEYARASDIDYLRDLGAGIDVADTDHLRRLAELTYEPDAWRLEARIEQLQTLKTLPSPGDPYRVMPQLALSSRFPKRNRSVNFHFSGEIARFEHHSNNVAAGVRIDLHPTVSFPIRSAAGHFVPRAALRYTGYDPGGSDGRVSDPSSRVVPVLGVDGGLVFDRKLTFRDRSFTQTLEPRLYYLRTPHRDQDHLPLFGTGTFTFGYDHLFRENRFSGTDRIGDEDRLTLALETRLLDQGHEVFAARLGHARHFRDRRVRLCTTADPHRSPFECASGGEDTSPDPPRSTWAAALDFRPHRYVTIAAAAGHDGSASRNRPISLDLRYHPSPARTAGIGWRRVPVATNTVNQVVETVQEVTESVGLAARWNLGRRWRIFGSMDRALEADRLTRSDVGFEYDSCCWRVRILGQRYLRNAREAPEYENAVLLQWELKGWTGSEIGLK